MLSRPGLEEVLSYRDHVDSAMRAVLAGERSSPVDGLIELGLHHEQQHQELILTDVKHLLSRNPQKPASRSNGRSLRSAHATRDGSLSKAACRARAPGRRFLL